MEQALRLGAEAVLRIAIAAAPDEVGALVGGRLVAPLVDVLLAGTGIPGTRALVVLLVLGSLHQGGVVSTASDATAAGTAYSAAAPTNWRSAQRDTSTRFRLGLTTDTAARSQATADAQIA